MRADLRAGVIGAGSMGRNHLRVLAELPGVQPVVVVDPFVDEAEIGLPVRELDEAAAMMDFAILAAPSELHEPIGLRLAELGVPTLIEKPLATTAAEAARLTAAFAQAGVLAAVGHIERFNPVNAALRAHLSDIGTVLAASTIRVGPFPDREMPVGVVPDLLVHDIDLLCWLLEAEYATVTAVAFTDPDRPCEDEVRVAARLECLPHVAGCVDGIAVDQHAGRLSAHKDRSMRFVGTQGSMEANLIDQTVTLRTIDGASRDLAVTRGQPLMGELVAWCDTVRSGTPNPALAALADGLRAVEVAEAILTSSAVGQTIELERMAA